MSGVLPPNRQTSVKSDAHPWMKAAANVRSCTAKQERELKANAHPLTKAAANVRSSTAKQGNECKIRCTPFDISCRKCPDFHHANSNGPLPPRQRKNCEVSETPCRDTLIMALLPLSLSTSRASSNQRPVHTDQITPIINYSVLRSKHIKGSKEHYLLGQKHNLPNVGVIPFIKLQNET